MVPTRTTTQQPTVPAVPAVDTTPTGRALPFLTDGPRDHTQPAETVGDCTVFPQLCTQAGPHTAHSNHLTADATDWPVSVGFETVFDGSPLLYVDTGHAVDFTADEAPTVIAQLRAAADAIEAMAARLTVQSRTEQA
ncbi:hypothetical protein ACFUG9_34050 [Streptomyces griseoincarnatus]